jgi:hypothetical protein
VTSLDRSMSGAESVGSNPRMYEVLSSDTSAGSVSHQVVVDDTLLFPEEVSPTKMSIYNLYMYTYREIHYFHTSHTPLWLHRRLSVTVYTQAPTPFR